MSAQVRTAAHAANGSYPQCIRELVGPLELASAEAADAGMATDEAHHLFAAMLDGGVPELELGGLLVALGVGAIGLPALLGFNDALAERVLQLRGISSERRPVVIPAYGGALHQPNLT